MRLTPYAGYRDLDGDLDVEGATQAFDQADHLGGGVRIDLFVEDTAYIGFEFEAGDDSRFYLTFAREY